MQRSHYVGHSNGTYLVAKALTNYPAARFGNIYFAGSVVDPRFDWRGLKQSHRIARFHNARGASDWVVALLPKSLEYFMDLGGAGFDGFDQIQYKDQPVGTVCQGLTQSKKYAVGGHSGAIAEQHWDQIAEFIVNGTPPFESGEEPELFSGSNHRYLSFSAISVLARLFWLSVAAVLLVLAYSWWLPTSDKWDMFHSGALWVLLGVAVWSFFLLMFLVPPISNDDSSHKGPGKNIQRF